MKRRIKRKIFDFVILFSNFLNIIWITLLSKVVARNPSVIKLTTEHAIAGLNNYSHISSTLESRLIRLIAYEGRDVRAPWIGAGIAQTDLAELRPFADWANSHWAMYFGFFEYFSIIEDGRILDIGCGTGNMTVNLSEIFPGFLIEGLDLNSRVLRFADLFNGGSNVEYKKENAFSQQNKNRFSACFAIEILEHIPATMHDQFIAGCLAALKPNGVLFLTTPNELDTPDAEYGHIGFLNRERAREFFSKFKKYIVEVSFYDNGKLGTFDLEEYIIRGSDNDYQNQDGVNRSHFRIVLRNI